jgi:hypothetical protein
MAGQTPLGPAGSGAQLLRAGSCECVLQQRAARWHAKLPHSVPRAILRRLPFL